MKPKHIKFSKLIEISTREKNRKKRIVLCHGVFDLLHLGHIKYLQEAKSLGDILLVTITPDRFVNKGPGRPAFNEKHRAEAIAALEVVDYVSINDWPNHFSCILARVVVLVVNLDKSYSVSLKFIL